MLASAAPFPPVAEWRERCGTLPALAFVLASPAMAEVPVLDVLTYDSFTVEWGPGPAIAKGFEATCSCVKVNYIAAGDGGQILPLKMEGAQSEADVVVGLDTSLVEAARATGLFAPVAAQPNDLPLPFADAEFQPFDWGWFAFVQNKALANPPVISRRWRPRTSRSSSKTRVPRRRGLGW